MSMVQNGLSVRERTSYWARIISNRNRQIGVWRSTVALPLECCRKVRLTVTAPVKKNLPPELLEAQKMGRAIARDEVPEDFVDFISGQIINVEGGKNMH